MRRSVADAKAKLSELIRAARAHQEVILTDRGRPVARLVPYEAEDEGIEGRFRSFRERGLLHPPTVSPKEPWPGPIPVKGALARFIKHRD